jgi:hypothetical protein
VSLSGDRPKTAARGAQLCGWNTDQWTLINRDWAWFRTIYGHYGGPVYRLSLIEVRQNGKIFFVRRKVPTVAQYTEQYFWRSIYRFVTCLQLLSWNIDQWTLISGDTCRGMNASQGCDPGHLAASTAHQGGVIYGHFSQHFDAASQQPYPLVLTCAAVYCLSMAGISICGHSRLWWCQRGRWRVSRDKACFHQI